MDVLLRFGASMLRAGNTAARTREWMNIMAGHLGFATLSVSLTFDGITASALHSGQWVTATRDVGPPHINASRIGALEQLARDVGPGVTAREIANKLAEIESSPIQYPVTQIGAAIAAATAAFAFLNGGALPEMIASGMGAGVGHCLRAYLARRHFNQYGNAALCAVASSGVYVLVAAAAQHFGVAFLRYPAGFIASVLFLIPGFPFVAALFDLLQYQTVAAVSRLAYGVMILLAVALGLGIVVTAAGIDVSRQPSLELAYGLKLVLRAAASFVAGCTFAMLFNSSPRTVLLVGLVALAANSLRLTLNDLGVMLAPATFLAALAIGLVALLADRRFNVPRMATVVAPIVIMMPGLLAFEMIVLFNHGQMLAGLQASVSCGFVVGALAIGLATARFFVRR